MTILKNNNRTVKAAVIAVVVIAALFAARTVMTKGAGRDAAMTAPPAPSVVTTPVKEADLAAQREYIGRVEAVQNVSLKPEVAGQIMQVHFKEGSVVKAGQLLFSIDSSQYQATVDLRKAEVAQAEANLDRASKYLDRVKKADKRSVSESDVDTAEANALSAKAALQQAKAALKLAQIDLARTRITAPIAGRIGAALFTKGNYVSPASGALATIVQMDPIRVTFSMADKDYLDALEAFKSTGDSVFSTTLKLTNGKPFAAEGQRDFEDNQVDGKTGTIAMRLRFKNPDGMLVPGSMVRLEMKPVESHVAVIIPQEAVVADSQGDYVYVVDDKNIAQQKRIKLGSEFGVMREVQEGLQAGEKLIIRGLQSVRPGAPVNPSDAELNGSKSAAEQAMESTADAVHTNGSGDAAESEAKPAEEAN